MRPGFRCERCTNVMDRVDPHTWICIPCRINEYWPEDTPDEEIERLLQREWNAAQLTGEDVA